MSIILNIGLFVVLLKAKRHGSGVKFHLISQKLTTESVNNSAKQIHHLVGKNIITIIQDFLPQPTAT
jgi:hypothetical protein